MLQVSLTWLECNFGFEFLSHLLEEVFSSFCLACDETNSAEVMNDK
uniref:Uncharacterized protein n=1 Tax=Rhizophora mucronata TaxID=61149 RepID=A0A2P2QJ88_RHIMU